MNNLFNTGNSSDTEEGLNKKRQSFGLSGQNVGGNQAETILTKSSGVIEGYLFMKVYSKSPMSQPTWLRRWFFIKEGQWGYHVVSRVRGMVDVFHQMSVLLCEIRPDEKQDRRYCFEILSSKR